MPLNTKGCKMCFLKCRMEVCKMVNFPLKVWVIYRLTETSPETMLFRKSILISWTVTPDDNEVPMLDENLNTDIRKSDLSWRGSFTTEFIPSWHSNQTSLISQGESKARWDRKCYKIGEMSYILNAYIFLYWV